MVTVERNRRFFIFFVLILLISFVSLNAFCKVEDLRPLRHAVDGSPSVDPHIGSGAAITFFYVNTYDTLVTYDIHSKILPLLAESWTASDDYLHYTFKLKKGVKFHDGTELKASDVVFSMNRLITMNVGFSYLFKGRVAKVEAIDDYTVRFDLSNKYALFIGSLTRFSIVNEKLIMANLNMKNQTFNYGPTYGDFGRDFLLTMDAGSGPYKFGELLLQNYLILDQFESYHIPFSENAPTSLKFIRNTEAMTIRTLLNKRELEVSGRSSSTELLEAISKIEGIGIGEYSYGSTAHIVFNCSLPPTDDINFRKALAYLVDYDLILNNFFPGSTMAIGPCNASTPGAGTQHEANPYKYDIEKAKEYLALSKYADKLDQYPVEFFHTTTPPPPPQIALPLSSAAQTIGMNMLITGGPYIAWQQRTAGKETTANVSTCVQSPWIRDAASNFLAQYTRDNVGTVANPFWILDETFDQMVYNAIEIMDTEKRYAEYAKIEKYILDNCFGAYLVDVVNRVGYQSTYVDWPADNYYRQTGKHSYTGIGFQYWYHDWKVFPEKKPKN